MRTHRGRRPAERRVIVARSRQRLTGRREQGSFSAWPHECANHPNFLSLSVYAKALLLCLIGQYKGNNNGDLDVTFHRMSRQNWRSRNTVEKARSELEQRGWIVRTRQGWRHSCSLYALTFKPIDVCGGKLDEPAGNISLGFWKEGRNPWLDRQLSSRPTAPKIKSDSHVVTKLRHRVTKKGADLSHDVSNLAHHVG